MDTITMTTGSFTYLCLTLVVITTAAPRDEPLRIIEEPRSQIVAHHSPVTLRCRTDPSNARLSWLFNGAPVTNPSVIINGGELRIPSFKYKPKDDSHVGTYQCIAETSDGAIVSREATLEKAVIHQFEDSPVLVKYVNATEGNVALIPCSPPRGDPPSITRFEVNSTTIDQSSSRHKIVPSGNLQIGKVKQSDGGAYRCVAINPATGQKRSAPYSVHLKVIAPVSNSPARIIQGPRSKIEVLRGRNLTLECVVEGSPVPVVTWDKYGGQLPEGRYVQSLGNLIISDIEKVDEGTYICRAENGEGKPVATISMVEVLEPPVIRAPPRDRVAVVGSTVTLQCLTRGHPQVKTEWLHNKNNIYRDSFITITDTSLVINNVQKDHGGLYQCLARNKLGMTYATASLKVRAENEEIEEEEFPVAPHEMQDIAPDAVLRDVRSSTPQPTENKPKPPMGTTPPGVFTTKNQHNSTSLILENINNGGRERGERKKGRGEGGRRRGGSSGRRRNNKKKNRAEEAGEVKLVPPSRPTIQKLSDSSVLMKWNVKENDGLPITFFKVQYKHINSNRRTGGWSTIDEDIPEDDRMYEVAGLQPGGIYKFRVVAVYSNNDNKHGPNSARFTLAVEPAHRLKAPVSPPVIVKVWQISSEAMNIEWQYLAVDQAPIEGYYLNYKPYKSSNDYKQVVILGASINHYVLTKLSPDTDYTIMIQGFNSAGHSDDSNQVVKKTLPSNGEPVRDREEYSVHVPPPDEPRATTMWTEVYTYPRNRVSTRSSSEMLYMILGIVLGVMMLLLVAFMIMCAWKQRQQRRMMAAINANMRKFEDPSKAIYKDSLRKKHLINGSPFYLNGIQPAVANGHVPTHAQNGGSRMNITLNPVTELDNKSTHTQSIGELRSSLQEMLPPPPSAPPPCCPDGNCNTIERGSMHTGGDSDTDNGSQIDPTKYQMTPRCREPHCYQPPDYYSLNRSRSPHSTFKPRSRDHLSQSGEVTSRSHDQLSQSYDRLYRSLDRRSHDHLSHGEQGSQSSGTSGGRHRRRHHHGSHGSQEQGANTDHSSNESTMDNPPRVPHRSLQQSMERAESPHLTATPPHSPARYPTPPHLSSSSTPHDSFHPHMSPHMSPQHYGHQVAPQNFAHLQQGAPQDFVYNLPESIRQDYDTIHEQTYQEIEEPNFYSNIPEESCSNVAEPSDVDSEGSDPRDLNSIDSYPRPHFAPDDISEDSYNLHVSENSYVGQGEGSISQSEVGDSGDESDGPHGLDDFLPPDLPRIHQYSPSQLKN